MGMFKQLRIIKKEMDSDYLLNEEFQTISDYGKAVVMAGATAVNTIMAKNGYPFPSIKTFMNKNGYGIDTNSTVFTGAMKEIASILEDSVTHFTENTVGNKDHPQTLEEFVSMTDELAHLDYTNIMKVFKSILEDSDIDATHLAENAAKIGNEELTKIREVLENDISNFIIAVNNLHDKDISSMGYSLMKIPNDKINDAIHYAKDAMINVIKDSAKDIWDIITGQNQINLAPKLSNPEAFTIQQQVFTPVPNYSGNKEIMKHFVIGNNVVIYDPHVQQSFEKDLISLSKRLDKVDKELKLKEPSKFGFVEFISPLNFKAVRLDESSNYVNSSDTDNYISVWTDKATLYISKPSKVTAKA